MPSLTLNRFATEYPFLAQFAREKSWKCGKVYISIRHKCYTDPKTGKVNYKKVINPKTGRTNRVKVGLDYNTYRKQRTAAVKKIGQIRRNNGRITSKDYSREIQLKGETYALRDRTRKKHGRIRNRRLLKNTLKGKTINQDWQKIPTWSDKPDAIVRSSVRKSWLGERNYSVAYEIGENKIKMKANRLYGGFVLDDLRSKTNIEDLFKAKNLDIDKIKPKVFNLSFTANRGYGVNEVDIIPLKNKSLTQTKIKITQAITKAHSQVVDTLPDISIAYNTPFLSDGKGLVREKLYKRVGYGTIKKQKNHISQAMVKIGKKIYPLAKKTLIK